jgi:hypothetical protein
MHKRTFIFLLAAIGALLCPFALRAQTPVDLDPELGGRLTIGVEKKLAKGLHLGLEEEVRLDNNFGSLGRLQTSLGLKYKVNDYLRLGLGYCLINPYSASTSAFKSSRHRLMADATAGYTLGDWRLSLRERIQATYRTGSFNIYQNPQPLLELKSRLKLAYKGLQRWEPYAYAELRHTLNAPVIAAVYQNGTYLTQSMNEKGDPGWFISGWNGAYLNRLRFSVGASYRLSKASLLDFYLLADRISEKCVDANAEGTKLKSYTRETGFKGWAGVSYTYKF